MGKFSLGFTLALALAVGVAVVSAQAGWTSVTRTCQGSPLECFFLTGRVAGRTLPTAFGGIDQYSVPLTDGNCRRWQPCALAGNIFAVPFTNATYMGPSQPQDPTTYLVAIQNSPLTLPGGPAFAEGGLELTLLLPVKTAAEVAAGVVFDTFFYTHGGGFAEGSSAVDYEMSQATKNRYNVIMGEYRLGMLGFMPMLVTGQPRRPQNHGLLDSYLGEQWYAAYARYWGIAGGRFIHGGQSAGATITSLLPMLRNPATGLLVKRIADAGVALSAYAAIGVHSATALPPGVAELPHIQLAREVGCLAYGVAPSPGSTTHITPAIEQCLLGKTWQQLFNTSLGVFDFTKFAPVLDGVTLVSDIGTFARAVVANPTGSEAVQWQLAGGAYQFWGNHGPIEGLLLAFAKLLDFGLLAGEATYADFVAEAQVLFAYYSPAAQAAARNFFGDRPLGTAGLYPGSWEARAQSDNWYAPLVQMAGAFSIVSNTLAAVYDYGLLPNTDSYLTAFIYPTTRAPLGSHSSDLVYFDCEIEFGEAPFSPQELAFCQALGLFKRAFFSGNVNAPVRIGADGAVFYPGELAGTQVQQFDGTLQTAYVLGAASTGDAYHPGGCDQVTPIAAGVASFPCLQRASGTDLAFVAAVHNGTSIAEQFIFV